MNKKLILSTGFLVLLGIFIGYVLIANYSSGQNFQGNFRNLTESKKVEAVLDREKVIPLMQKKLPGGKTHVVIDENGKAHVIDNETGEELPSSAGTNSSGSGSSSVDLHECEHGYKKDGYTYYNYCFGTDYNVTKVYSWFTYSIVDNFIANFKNKISDIFPSWNSVDIVGKNGEFLSVNPKLHSLNTFDGYLIYGLAGGQENEYRPPNNPENDRTYIKAKAFFNNGTSKTIDITAFDSGYFAIGKVGYSYLVSGSSLQGEGSIGELKLAELKNINQIKIPLKGNIFLVYKNVSMPADFNYNTVFLAEGENGTSVITDCMADLVWVNCQ